MQVANNFVIKIMSNGLEFVEFVLYFVDSKSLTYTLMGNVSRNVRRLYVWGFFF